MKYLQLEEIIPRIKGKLIIGSVNRLIKHVATKPRKTKDSTLFFDLNKNRDLIFLQRFNYVVIVTAHPENIDNRSNIFTIVKVANVHDAYWSFIDYYRGLLKVPFIGVTGTCGKTTTKEMIKHIVSNDYEVCCTYQSQNSSSLNLDYLISVDDKTEVAVFEMGVAGPNDLVRSCKYFQPEIRVMLNIGVHHLLGCGTPEIYFNAKLKFLEGLDTDTGVLILNADDQNLKKMDVRNFKNVIYFSLREKSDFTAKNTSYVKGGMAFTLQHQNQDYQVFIPGYGQHNVYNALAAIAAASRVGLSVSKACEALANFKQPVEHLDFHTGVGNCRIIDDTWNNSPLSMTTALEVLQKTANNQKKVALLGYMPQLGNSKYAIEQYNELGKKVVETAVDLLVVVGENAKEIGKGAIDFGMDEKNVHFCNSGSEIYQLIKPSLNENTSILLKITHRQMVEPSFAELKNKLLLNNNL